MMNRPKQFYEGFASKAYGSTIDDNPYDRASQPEQYKSWREGWKQANFQVKEARNNRDY